MLFIRIINKVILCPVKKLKGLTLFKGEVIVIQKQ